MTEPVLNREQFIKKVGEIATLAATEFVKAETVTTLMGEVWNHDAALREENRALAAKVEQLKRQRATLIGDDVALEKQILDAGFAEFDAEGDYKGTAVLVEEVLQQLAAAQEKLKRFYELGVDCQSNSCRYAQSITGMRHNGPCKCKQNYYDLPKERDTLQARVTVLEEALTQAIVIAERNTYMGTRCDPGGNFGGPGCCEYGCGKVIAGAIRKLTEAR